VSPPKQRPIDPPPVCVCGHPQPAHQHYRRGSDCGFSGCSCDRYQAAACRFHVSSRRERAAVSEPPSITCPRCGKTSHHPDDVREGYCGACHDFTGPADLEYAMTFGCQYGADPRRLTHPTWPPADADGWVTILAPDESSARACAFRLFGKRWAFIYPPGGHDPKFFPLGELARVHCTATEMPR